MITFQGNKQTLKYAKMLESKARNMYPHISTSRIRTQIGIETPDPSFFTKLKKEYSLARKMIRESGDYYTALLFSLKEGKIGNCTEDAMLVELLGKLNGQQNIYSANIGLSRNGKSLGCLNHVVAIITDKPVKGNENCFFKNKDAIIVDPWLNVTDFAGNYFNKLKSTYRKIFMYERSKNFATFTNDELAMELLRAESKTPKEFKSKKKEYCPTTTLSIIPFVHNLLSPDKLEVIRDSFPELVIKSFKKIELPTKKCKTAKIDSIV